MSAFTHEYKLPMPLAGDAARVFGALTQPNDLKAWFADEVEVVPETGGAFRFWGVSVYGAPKAGVPDQRLTIYAPDTDIAFVWPLHGIDSEVSFAVTPGDEGATIAVKHHFPHVPEVSRFEDLIDDVWRLALGNLYCYLKDGKAAIRPDFTDTSPTVTSSIFIDAPPDKVFNALVDPAMLDKWMGMGGKASVEPRAGGIYNLDWNYEMKGRKVVGGPTRILELVPGKRLVTDWTDWRGDPDVPQQTITWDVTAEGKGTRVTLVHSGFLRPADISDYGMGWPYFLGKLAEAVHTPVA